MSEEQTYRTYGNWRRPRETGILGATFGTSIAAIAAAALVIITGLFFGLTVSLLLALIQRGCVAVPLASAAEGQKAEFLEIAGVEQTIACRPAGPLEIEARDHAPRHALVAALAAEGHPGLVLFSSGSVYGASDEPLGEESPLRATDFYAATKVAAERLALAYEGLLGVAVLRLFVPYGPGQRARMVPAISETFPFSGRFSMPVSSASPKARARSGS